MTQIQPDKNNPAKEPAPDSQPFAHTPGSAYSSRKGRFGNKMRFLVAVAILAVAAGIYTMRFSDSRPVVSVQRIAPAPTDRILIVSGRTRSELEADLRTAVSGMVMRTTPKEGTRVQAGEILIQLDDMRARLQAQEAQTALDSAILNQQQAMEDLNRKKALGTAISEEELTRAAEALAAAKLEVQRLSSALKRAKIMLSDYQIMAPFSATILERPVEAGEFVQAGSVVTRIADLSRLFVEIEVDENYSASIQTGQKALIQLAGRSQTLSGRVSLIEPEVNKTTGALPVRIAFDQLPDLPTGLTTTVNVIIASNEAALTVPRTALVQQNGLAAVYTLQSGKAVLTPVKIIDWPADQVEVLQGLQTGDQVILNPEQATDGKAVKPVPPAADKEP